MTRFAIGRGGSPAVARGLARRRGATPWLVFLAPALLLGCRPEPGTTAPLRFDTAHVEAALAYLAAPSEEGLERIASTAAARHLARHSDLTGYYAPGTSTLDISRKLLSKPLGPEGGPVVTELLAGVRAAPEAQRACLAAAAEHLPLGFEFAQPLYVTWGYDIGVAVNGSASINLAHPRFADDPAEIWFYCTHEMHHAGLTSFQPFPFAVSEMRSTRQLLRFIRYATMLEGMAVHAARGPRQRAGALDADPDYVALADTERMLAFEDAYWRIYRGVEAAGDRPLDEFDWKLVDRLSGGDRLWYRVGAHMAATLEAKIGTTAYRELPRQGPDAFFDLYLARDG